MQDQSTGMEKSTTEAKSYAESITILNSTENKAPELVYEEDEMDEDGDEDDDDIDDDLNLSFVYFNNHFITYLLSFYSLALEVETSINLKTIDADDSDVAYAISATFIFDVVMVILFPIMGAALGLSDMAFGLWAGTAVNDTSSVVAAGYAYSDAAGDFATIVKLTRTLSIIPVVLAFSYLNEKLKMKQNAGAAVEQKKVNLKKIFPWFILLFLGAALLNSVGIIPAALSSTLSTLSKFFMVMALAAIGLKTDIRDVTKSGFLPMLHGFIISAIVVIVALLVQVLLGQV